MTMRRASLPTRASVQQRRGLTLKRDLIWMLIRRELLISFRVSRSGHLLVLIEPVAQFAMMYVIFSAIQRQPGFGTSLGLFLATGLIPYFMFLHLSSRVMGAIRSYRSFARIPTVTPLDVAIARGTLEFFSLLVFATVVLAILQASGQSAAPRHPETLAAAVLTIGAAAFGVGLINGVLSHMFKFYALAYSILARSALFFSAVFYVPATLPAQARTYISYNPILHAVEWFRTGIYSSYPAFDLSYGYLAGWAIATISLGVMLLSVTKRWLAR